MRPEAAIQRQVVSYLSLLEGQGKLTYFAVPNGGRRGVIEAANFKREGVRGGVPDICILLPEDHAALLEIKTPKGRVSPAQSAFMNVARNFTPNIFLARSFDEARSQIDALCKAFPRRVAA